MVAHWAWRTFASHKLLEKAHPLHAALAVFASTFGIISFVRIFFEGRFYLSRYAAYWIGDVFFITLYMFCMSIICKEIESLERFYKKPGWHLLVLTSTSISSLLLQYTNLQNGEKVGQFVRRPSQWVHVGIAAVLGYYVISLLPIIFDKRIPASWARRGAFAAMLAYVATLLWDIFIANGPPDPW